MEADLRIQSIAKIRADLQARKFSCRELVQSHLKAIQERDQELKSFLFLDEEGAVRAAQELDQEIEQGNALAPLAGVVMAIKDNIAVQAMPATAASHILEGYLPPYDATVVKRLKKAGAIIIGKTNLDEFAMGASTEQSGFHPTRNPHDPSRVPGGSSGGSASAVAAGLCVAALGSDTGGSIRQPAAFCGIIGMRPTYGSVSRYGLIAMASSMDVVGPIARSAQDARAVLAVISGYDPSDATSIPHHVIPQEASLKDAKKLKIGIPKEYLEGALSREIQEGFQKAVRVFEKLGAKPIELSLPTTRVAVPTYYVITPAEVSSNLSRYDGIRFGPRIDLQLKHGEANAKLRGDRFGSEPKRRILVGTFTLSEGYAERYYHTAQKVRTLIREDFAKAFRRVDILLTPTTPTPAFPIGSIQDPISMYRQDVFLSAVSLAGLPAISFPVPANSTLPVGVQLIGRQLDDHRLLSVAESFEQALKSS